MAKTVLPSGVRIVTEREKSVRSAAFGIWVNVGSRDENTKTAGASHFLEHLLFKGTKRRSALEISSAIEAVGGDTNAFTGKEYTCFYARVIDKDLPLAVDVICDLITSSLVEPVDVDAERKVVLEEIAMRDDDPSDLIHDLFLENYYGDSTLGRPILGSVKSIKNMSRQTVFDYYRNKYQPQDLVVSVAGNIKHRQVVRMVEDALSKDSFLDRANKSSASLIRPDSKTKVTGAGKVSLTYRKTEQAHLIYGVPGVARNDSRRFALSVLASALGGGMSSRMFQEIREKRGLAYSVYAYPQQFAGTGVLTFYVGCKPDKAYEVSALIQQILADVAKNGLTAEEINRAKGSVSGSLVLSQEDTGSRMNRIGKAELVSGKVLSFDEILKEIAAVTPDQIIEIARQSIKVSPTLSIVGPLSSKRKFERLIK
jgi:predicted Zn-dependent peptidase